MSDSQHAIRTTFIDYDKPGKPEQKERETAYTNKNIGQWNVTMDTDQNGKLTISASRTIEKIRGDQNEATITLRLDTTSNRVPEFK